MSAHDFEAGMIAGAKPFEAKFSEQASNFKKTRETLETWCDRYGSLVDVVLDDLGNQEKQRIYKIQSKLDPADMGESEQELLVCILYTVAQNTETTSEERSRLRQKFLGGLQNYMDITNPQSQKEISDLQESIENIDRKSEEKTIFQVLAEYLYLTYGNFDFLKTSPIIPYFSAVVTADFLEEVQESIDEQFRAVGPEGLAEKYRNLKAAKRDAAESEKMPKPRVYVALPKMGKKKDSKTAAEIKSAKELKAQLQNSGFPRLETAIDVDFWVYFPTSPDVESIKETFENDRFIEPIYDHYGCQIYCKGSNILLCYKKPDNLDNELREKIVKQYSEHSTRAHAPEIQKWEKAHILKEKEDYLTHKANVAIDSVTTSVKKIAQEGMRAQDKRIPVAIGKKVGGTALRGLQVVGTLNAKVVVGVGGIVETAGDKATVKSSNMHFDTKILPQIQRDLLIFKLVELLENGVIKTK